MKVVCPRHTFAEYIIVRDTRLRDIVIADSVQRRLAQEGFLKLSNTRHDIKNRLSLNSWNGSAADMLEINDEMTDGCFDTFLFFSVKLNTQRTIVTEPNDVVFET